jgi:hypothetical protein
MDVKACYQWYRKGLRVKRRYGNQNIYWIQLFTPVVLPQDGTSEFLSFCAGLNQFSCTTSIL